MTTQSARTAPRARGTPSVAAELSRLTDRDKKIIDLLHEHQVPTTEHINAMFFDHPATGRNRLRQLLQREILRHFRGYVSNGTESWRWTLGYHPASPLRQQPAPPR